jgi:hypothetical protein
MKKNRPMNSARPLPPPEPPSTPRSFAASTPVLKSKRHTIRKAKAIGDAGKLEAQMLRTR